MNYYSVFVEKSGTVCLADADGVGISNNNIITCVIFYIYMRPRIEISALDRLEKKPNQPLYKLKKKNPHKNVMKWYPDHHTQIIKTGTEDVA